METRRIEVEFKVAMDKEAAKNKDYEVVNLEVVIGEEHLDAVVEAAIKSQVILWQGQIRNNWDKFMADDYEQPEELEFGQPLFGPKKRTVVRNMTTEEMLAELKKDPEKMAEFIAALQS